MSEMTSASITLASIEEIKQLKARYFRFIDTQDWDALSEVFTKDAILQWGPEADQVMEGRDAILTGLMANLEGAVTCHQGHMPEIELQGPDRARGIWSMTDRVDHPNYLLIGYGHYHEEYVKQDGRWRIAHLKLTRLHEERTPKP
jgi:hypothetical protein